MLLTYCKSIKRQLETFRDLTLLQGSKATVRLLFYDNGPCVKLTAVKPLIGMYREPSIVEAAKLFVFVHK